MRFGFLTLLVLAACGQQPLSQTQCLRASSVSWRGDTQQLGCFRPDDKKSLPEKVVHAFKPTVRGVFAQQQSNGLHCLYTKRALLDGVQQGTMSVAALGKEHGNSKVLSKVSVADDDVQTALRVQHAAMQLTLWQSASKADRIKLMLLGFPYILSKVDYIKNTCRNPSYLYRKVGDAFRAGNTLAQYEGRLRAVCGEQLTERLLENAANKQEELHTVSQTASQIFRGKTATFGYDAATRMNIAFSLMSFGNVAAVLWGMEQERNNYIEQTVQLRKIETVLPWIDSNGASVCRRDISI